MNFTDHELQVMNVVYRILVLTTSVQAKMKRVER